MEERSIQVVRDAHMVATTAAELVMQAAKRAIGESGTFSIALSGGNTPKSLYEILAEDGNSRQIDWNHWEIFFGDERCVPSTHQDSNFRMASEAMLDRVSIPPEHIHRMKGEIDPEQAAIEYGKMLKDRFEDGGLDLVLLGMGDDGHTASLFPGTVALDEMHHRCMANHVPKLNTWRLTMTAPFINRAAQVIILVSGAGKAARLAEVLEGPREPNRLPIQLIQPVHGKLIWLVDAPAAGMDQ